MTHEVERFTTKIAKYFQSARIKKGLSMRQVESLSGISYSYISRFEGGSHTNLSLPKLFALANAIGINITKMFEEIN